MDFLQVRQRRRRIGLGGSDELQQRFRVVGGDLRMGQGRAQAGGVRRQRQLAIAFDPQAFTLDAVQATGEQGQVGALAEQGQAAGKKIAQFGILHASVAPIWGWTKLSTRGGLRRRPKYFSRRRLALSLRPE
ncbi:hypothetical protein D3C76_1508610 [compost metagenome]